MALDTQNGYGKDMDGKYAIVCDIWSMRLTHEPGTSTGYAGSGSDPPYSIVMFSLGDGNGKRGGATFFLLRRIDRPDLK